MPGYVVIAFLTIIVGSTALGFVVGFVAGREWVTTSEPRRTMR